MAIVVVSRWKGNYAQALPIARQAAAILKRQVPLRRGSAAATPVPMPAIYTRQSPTLTGQATAPPSSNPRPRIPNFSGFSRNSRESSSCRTAR